MLLTQCVVFSEMAVLSEPYQCNIKSNNTLKCVELSDGSRKKYVC